MRLSKTYNTKKSKRSLKKVIEILAEFNGLGKRGLIKEYHSTNDKITDAYHRYNTRTCCRLNKKLYLKKRIIETTLEEKYNFRINCY